MHSSRRYGLHLERSKSVSNIGSQFNPGLCTNDDGIPTITKKNFQPAIVKPSQTTKRESKDSKPGERSNTARPSRDPSGTSQNSSNLSKQATPALAEVLSHVSAATSLAEEEERHRSRVIQEISFIKSPERELLVVKKIEEDDEVGLFGEFIKRCALCKKELKRDKDIYMYSDRPFCSSDCRDDRIALDGFNRKDFGLGKEDQKTMKSLKKDLNQLQMYL